MSHSNSCLTLTVHGNYTEWEYGECSVSCYSWDSNGTRYGGLVNRTRNCTNPAPRFYGNDCVGEPWEIVSCGTEDGNDCPPSECADLKKSNYSAHNAAWWFLPAEICCFVYLSALWVSMTLGKYLQYLHSTSPSDDMKGKGKNDWDEIQSNLESDETLKL